MIRGHANDNRSLANVRTHHRPKLDSNRCVEHGIPLIPVLLPGAAGVPDDLAFLRELTCVQFRNDLGEKAAMVRLVWGITSQKPDQLARGAWRDVASGLSSNRRLARNGLRGDQISSKLTSGQSPPESMKT